MIIFTIMSLILTVGGVSALLRKNVFLPLQKLRNYAESTASDNIPEPPPHLPHDLDVIAAAVHDLKTAAAGKKHTPDKSDS